MPPNTSQAPACQAVDLSRRHEGCPEKMRECPVDFALTWFPRSRYVEPSSVPNTYRGSVVGA
jgi:hypothetical protein